MSTLMKFQAGSDVLQFEDGAQYPATRGDEILQVSDRTASGEMQTETLGITLKTRVLAFALMSETDYLALLNWFLNVAQAGVNPFTFTDEKGFVGEVKFLDTKLTFRERAFQRYSGSVTLEYQQ